MAYGLTNSIDLEASSSQYARRTSGLTGFWTTSGHRTSEAWIKIESLPALNGVYSVTDFGADGTTNGEFGLKFKNVSGNMVGYHDVYNRVVQGSNNLGLSTGTWYHFATTYDGTNLNWYVNGVLIEAKAAGTITTAPSPIVGIGGRTLNPAYGEHFDGKISLVRFWASARTQSEIADNMCNVLGSTANLAAEYTLDSVYTDNSGNGNTLTAANSPTFGADLPATCAVVPRNHLLLLGVS